jgi:hypothetical protein
LRPLDPFWQIFMLKEARSQSDLELMEETKADALAAASDQ